eukprot:gnl/Spiro4/921_TR489_c0_g1_i1.p1 gnl/Spiro4/921_TR489_c0_g1~~gnl/Spiro4/921_TR489_c0_g1_i1.p1  ORF type:complete len:535 (+),score=97.13 gnl/Spiro4/921_TR489_c0_g1_i1:77-1681(+)
MQMQDNGLKAPLLQGQMLPNVVEQQPNAPYGCTVPSVFQEPVPSFVEDDLHKLHPNAFSADDIVAKINGDDNERVSSPFCLSALCRCLTCCGLVYLCSPDRVFATKVGVIKVGLDGNKKPLAFQPNDWHFVSDPLTTLLGEYDMINEAPFACDGVNIIKIDGGSVVFADQSGLPVMITSGERTGWFVSTKPGFHVATQIRVNGQLVNSPGAKASEPYVNYESLHIFNVQPNTVHIVALPNQRRDIYFRALRPGHHAFNSPYMRSVGIISTAIQDLSFNEPAPISTCDGVTLTNLKAVLRCQVKETEIEKLLQIDIVRLWDTITDSARRTLLHEISAVPYQGYQDQRKPAAPGAPTVYEDPQQQVAVVGNLPRNQGFRYELENRMVESLREALRPLGIHVISFALQSFIPPQSLTDQVIKAIATRTEAGINRQAADADNATRLARARNEAESILIKQEAEAKAIQIKARADADAIVTRANALKEAQEITGVTAQQQQAWETRVKAVDALTKGSIKTLITGNAGALQMMIDSAAQE